MIEYVIFGSGPTLDNADFDSLPKNRIAVNCSAYVVKDCNLVSSIDAVYEDHIVYIAQRLMHRIVTPYTLEVSLARGIDVDNYTLVDICKSSTGAAVLYAINNGAEKIIMYGIGGVGYAELMSDYCVYSEKSQRGYDEAKIQWMEYIKNACVEIEIR